jgi:hypothetical protein
LILAKDTRRKKPWFDYLHKSNLVLIISVDIVKVEQGIKVVIIVHVCKPDDGPWIEAKIKAPEMFFYRRWSLLMSWKHGNNFSKVHASTFNSWNTIWLVSRETHVKNILFQSISEVKIQQHVDEPQKASWSTY